MAYCMNIMGNVYLEKQEHEIAQWYYEESLKIYEKNNNKKGINIVKENLGLTLYELGFYDEALEKLN